MIRDDETNRLLSYAKGLGVKVSFRQKKKTHSNSAEWYVDGSQIVVYTWKGQSKLSIVLNMVHELAHHLHWIKENRKPDTVLINALDKEDQRKRGERLDKRLRKLIYDDEVEASKYWEEIINLVDIKIPSRVILINKQIDLFVYSHYYETGEFPTSKVLNQKKREFRNESK